MRAVVAYAGRTANRLSSALCGVVADDILDDVLRLVDTVSRISLIGEMKQASVAVAVQHLTEAYAAAPANMKSPEKFRVVFSLTHAALAAISAIEASVNSERARYEMKAAVEEAQRAVGAIESLEKEAAIAAAESARRDYEVLLRVYGEHDEVIIGEPIDCFGGVS
jgi:hypothetical protein